jgi:hypothetical protein
MLLVFERADAAALRPVQVAALLSSLEEIFLVTLLRDAPPPDHQGREWAWDYHAQSLHIRLAGLTLSSPLHVLIALPWHAFTLPFSSFAYGIAHVFGAPTTAAPMFDRAREDFWTAGWPARNRSPSGSNGRRGSSSSTRRSRGSFRSSSARSTSRCRSRRRPKRRRGERRSRQCGRRDSNPHGLRHRHLKPACLPVPPRPPRTAHRRVPRAADCKVRASMADDAVRIEHPNRAKASSKATRAVVILLLLVSAALVLVVTIGGWKALQGAKAVQIGYIAIYLVIAFYVARWNRGVLPLAAALAIILLIFAAVAGPAWFDRDKTGFTDPALDSGLLGLITLLIVPVQALLIAFAMQGFAQQWSVEVERHSEPPTGSRAGGRLTYP